MNKTEHQYSLTDSEDYCELNLIVFGVNELSLASTKDSDAGKVNYLKDSLTNILSNLSVTR